jgi:hypothetical protein
MKEYFLVAIADRDEAMKALRVRRQLLDVHNNRSRTGNRRNLEWLDVRPGEIFLRYGGLMTKPRKRPRDSCRFRKLNPLDSRDARAAPARSSSAAMARRKRCTEPRTRPCYRT